MVEKTPIEVKETDMDILEQFSAAQRDERIRRDLFPRRVVSVKGKTNGAERLLSRELLQITTSEPAMAVLENGEGGEEAGILLDYGAELHGGARLLCGLIQGENPARVRLTFGESASEALSDIGGKNAGNDHAPRDMTVALPALSDTAWGETGFRFLCVRLLSRNTKLLLKGVTAVFIYRDIPYLGSFRCDRDRLNRIYDTAAYTCHLNMQRYVWDGIKRDRLVWVGDMHPEMLTIRTVFGRQPLLEDTLRFARETTPLPGWMNGMPTYSLWWLLIVWDWYWYTGSRTFLEENRDYALVLIRQITDLIRADGSDTLPGYFLDWPSHERAEEKDGSRALLSLALEAGEKLAVQYGEEAAATCCSKKRSALRLQPIAHYGSKQTAAMLGLARLLDEKQAAAVVLKDGARRMSTFMSYYLLKIAAAEDMKAALEMLETYYGGMLERGATTFWEDFDVDWLENSGRIDEPVPEGIQDIHGDNGAFCYKGLRHSLCHGWASGPTAFLAEDVLGIHILEAGCGAIELRPKLGDLQWARGTYPTPLGILRVEHCRQPDGDIRTTWDAPAGMRVVLP